MNQKLLADHAVASVIVPVAKALISTQNLLDKAGSETVKRFGETGYAPIAYRFVDVNFSISHLSTHVIHGRSAFIADRTGRTRITASIRLTAVSLPELTEVPETP